MIYGLKHGTVYCAVMASENYRFAWNEMAKNQNKLIDWGSVNVNFVIKLKLKSFL